MTTEYAPERDIYLDKIGRWTTGAEIKKAKENKEAIRSISFFSRYKRYGLPYSSVAWGESPAPMVEMLDNLDAMHNIYFPMQRLI